MKSLGIKYKKYFDLNRMIKNVKEYLPDFNRARFLEAFEFAENAHHGQLRKDGETPYFVHPVKTAEILISMHADEDTLIAAILHDVPEDTKYSIEEIKQRFGEKVAFLVDGITKLSKVHYQHNMPERQIESLRKMLLHSSEDLRIIVIKLADRLHNMNTLEFIPEQEKRSRIANETLEIYVPIANLLGIREMKNQLEDSCFRHLFPFEYEALKKKLDASGVFRMKNFKKFREILLKEFYESGLNAEILIRNKNLYGIYKKLCARGDTIETVDDRIGIKIIVKDIPDCYKALGIIHNLFVPNTDKFRDYVANPKINSYQSLHTTVFGVNGILSEVHIRTKEMDVKAEYGLASKFLDPKNKNMDFSANLSTSSWVKKVLDIEKGEKKSGDFIENLKLDVFQDRIFVFTPKGEPIDLPKGASALDFAYAIHSEVGHHAKKANVNGKLKPISSTLKTSDVVDIITSPDVCPQLAWLSFVRTNFAKNKILNFLKKIGKEQKIQLGRSILQKEFDIFNLGVCEDMNFKKLKGKIFDKFGENYQNWDDLFSSICEGNLKSADVVKCVDKHKTKDNSIQGIKLDLKISAKNRFGLLRDISEVLYAHCMDIYYLKGWSSKYQQDAYFTSKVLIRSKESAHDLFNELEEVDSVEHVSRFSANGVILFWISVFVIAAAWIIHPFIIRYLISNFQDSYPLATNFLVYGILFFLMVNLLFVITLIKKYFPVTRNRKKLWVGIFSLPVLTMLILGAELFLFDLKLNWFVLFLEFLIFYSYLVFTYINFAKFTQKT